MASGQGGGQDAVPPDEVLAAVGALSQEELVRLEATGRMLVLGIPGHDGHDVLMTAIERILKGSSTWRSGTRFDQFIYGVMRNVASQWRDLKSSRVKALPAVGHAPDGKQGVEIKSPDPNPEQVLLEIEAQEEAATAAKKTVMRIELLFEDDIEVQAVLYGIRNDKTASQVQQEFGLTATEYATARTRLRRKLKKEFPGRTRRTA